MGSKFCFERYLVSSDISISKTLSGSHATLAAVPESTLPLAVYFIIWLLFGSLAISQRSNLDAILLQSPAESYAFKDI